MKRIDPIKFFSHLKWLDGQPLLNVIEPYRRRIFSEALYSFHGKDPKYNLVLTGRSKKNFKSCDLILASIYRLLAWDSPLGNQCYILANDQGQAADDLELAKKIIQANPVLMDEVSIKKGIIERKDSHGFIEILAAKDTAGAHGKTYLFCGFDEVHEYRDWALLEALSLDPHRPDGIQWIATYASLYNYKGCPLYDLSIQGKQGKDPRMFFNWYAADFGTDPEYAEKEIAEERANPSILPAGYLSQQKKRLPAFRYRRLHLNIPGSPEGAYLSPEHVEAAIKGYLSLPYEKEQIYAGFCDMSGGSADDATLGIAHREDKQIIVDLITNQGTKPPFDPRDAINKFVRILKQYSIYKVMGDKYAGDTFLHDFENQGITYEQCPVPKSKLYETLEVELNGGRLSLPDNPKMLRQLLTLILKGGKIDHASGDHDDLANAAAGAVYLLHDDPGEPGEIYSEDSPFQIEQAMQGEIFMDNQDNPWDL